LKIFVSYSQNDARDFAESIKMIPIRGLDVFFDKYNDEYGQKWSDIRGQKWSDIIKETISTCEIFVVIFTPGILNSEKNKREILQAMREDKKIIICFSMDIAIENIKMNFEKYDILEFQNGYVLAFKLYQKLTSIERMDIRKVWHPSERSYAYAASIETDISKQHIKDDYKNEYWIFDEFVVKDWNTLLQKKVKDFNDKDLGKIIEIKEDRIITQEWIKKKYQIPKQTVTYDGHNLRVRLTGDELEKYTNNKPEAIQINDTIFQNLIFDDDSAAITSSRGINIRDNTGDVIGIDINVSGNVIGKNIIIDKNIEENKPVNYFKKIIRYPVARFPEKILLNEITPLEIIIKTIKSEIQSGQYSTPIEINPIPGNKEVPIYILAECSKGLEILDKYYETINVPFEVKDSQPIIFRIKSIEEGVQKINLRFYQESTNVGCIEIYTKVVTTGIDILPNNLKKIRI
jgi:hypothetical protein